MDKQYSNFLNTLDKKRLITIIDGLNQEISNLHKELKEKSNEADNNAVSDSEYTIIKALRDMMSDQVSVAIEQHNNDYHL